MGVRRGWTFPPRKEVPLGRETSNFRMEFQMFLTKKSPFQSAQRVSTLALTIFLTLFCLFCLVNPLPARENASPAPEPTPETVTAALSTTPGRVAVLLPLSGDFASLGEEMRSGFELGFAHLDAAGRKPDFTVAYLDTESDPDTAQTLVAMLASEGGTLVAAGTPLNPCAFTASRAAENAGLPYIIIGADQDDLIHDKSLYSFRLTWTRSALNESLKDFIRNRKSAIQTIGIIHGENPCAVRNGRRLRDLVAGLSLDLEIWETYRDDESNFYDLLNLVKERRPELLMLVLKPDATRKLWLQGKRLELLPESTIALPDGCFPAAAAGPVASTPRARLIHPAAWQPDNRGATSYPPLENRLQAAAFAGAEVICDALDRAPSEDAAAIRAALEATSLQTVYGPVAFSGPGRGHQNQLPWQLVFEDENGETQIAVPETKQATPSPKPTTKPR